MTEPLNNLIEALREELRQYGEMLARLDVQHECISTRASDELLASVHAVQEQAAVLEKARAAREGAQNHVAETLRLPCKCSLAQLCGAVRGPRGPLLQALVDENNHLLVRVQQRARQNHLLLRRSIDMMQDFMRTLCPATSAVVYDPAGRSQGGGLPVLALCDVAG